MKQWLEDTCDFGHLMRGPHEALWSKDKYGKFLIFDERFIRHRHYVD
jgi:hypothetical protein